MKIPISKPFFGPEEMRAVQLPLETGWVVQGRYVSDFEASFCSYTGASHAAATSSCTTALHIAVAALDLKPGDEVIVPAFTWVATANVVEYMGARPVFCDVDLQTFNIDVAQIESHITPRTVGILPVHLFGLCADMAPILEIAKRKKLWVVEDAACALGGWYQGKHAGTIGDAGCFSFHPRKSITTGEGGILSTENSEIDRLARTLRDHGASRSDLDRHTAKAGFLLAEYDHLGYNYRMTDIQGALGHAQMQRLSWILSERTKRAGIYDEALSEMDWLRPQRVPEGSVHGYQAYVSLFSPEGPSLANVQRLHDRRNAVMTQLEEAGIATRQGTHAPILLGYYAGKYQLKPEAFPNAFLADRLGLTLPVYPQMSDEDQNYVLEHLAACQPL